MLNKDSFDIDLQKPQPKQIAKDLELSCCLKRILQFKVAIVIAYVVCFSGWGLVCSMPNQFVSEAKVRLVPYSLIQPTMIHIPDNSGGSNILLTNVEQIIKRSDLNKTVKTEGDLQQLLEHFKKNYYVQRIDGSEDIYKIAYQSKDPILANNVLQTVLTVFLEQLQQENANEAFERKSYMENQIREYEIRLKNAKKARETFLLTNRGFLQVRGEQKGNVQKVTTALEEENQRLKLAISKKDSLLVQLLDYKSQQLAKTQSRGEHDNQERHIQAMNLAIKKADANISSLRSHFYKTNTRLSLETERQNLDRDYSVLENNYKGLLAHRNQNVLPIETDHYFYTGIFKIIDTPTRPLKPSSPNRILLFSAVFALGVFLGFRSAFSPFSPLFPNISSMPKWHFKQLIEKVKLNNKKDFVRISFAIWGLIKVDPSVQTNIQPV